MADKENRMMIKEEGAELGAFGPTNKMKGKQVVTFDPADDSSQSPLPQNKLSYASEGTSEGLAVSQGLEPTSTGIKKKKKKQTKLVFIHNLGIAYFLTAFAKKALWNNVLALSLVNGRKGYKTRGLYKFDKNGSKEIRND
ncbi:hypothetical protein CTI12_AA381930 [Artemisia annua]|uniref:Uncharacterized protein n=1 Tax=Artemisia annua TaxID=35608 RepID=A0A2U1MGM0_ARTAN|nr:hypothetical protein CTI12_AA381930 [Artemisia annua]